MESKACTPFGMDGRDGDSLENGAGLWLILPLAAGAAVDGTGAEANGARLRLALALLPLAAGDGVPAMDGIGLRLALALLLAAGIADPEGRGDVLM